jgi:hypothetical protein
MRAASRRIVSSDFGSIGVCGLISQPIAGLIPNGNFQDFNCASIAANLLRRIYRKHGRS